MEKFDDKTINNIARNTTKALKSTNIIPYRTGALKSQAIYVRRKNRSVSVIVFDGDKDISRDGKNVKNYLPYLDNGTREHDIPGAFGNKGIWYPPSSPNTAQPFGVGGRFNGKFHPGSFKHRGFIVPRSLWFVIDHIVSEYNGKLSRTPAKVREYNPSRKE